MAITTSYLFFAILPGAILSVFLYRFVRDIYRLRYHKLAKFPGPRAAAVSTDWLYKVSMEGDPEAEFARLHEAYGSHAIRIAPNELHLSDPDLYKTVYSQDGRYPKEDNFYKTFANDHGVFGTMSPSLHKILRQRMTPCFSHGNMVKGQSLMTSSLTELAAKLEARGYTRPVDMYSFCRCFPPDVISKFAFGQSTVLSACDDDFRTPILESFDAASKGTWYRAYFPHMRWLQDMMPIGIVARFNEELQRLKDFQDFGRNGIRNVRAGATNGTELAPMMSSVKDLPEEAIQGTAISFIGGGSDTAGYTLAFASWHVLRDANLHKRLLAELDPIFDAAAPEMPDLATLESAPVLNAVVNESLRCGPALPGRLPRVVPENAKAPLIVDGELVPAGTIVGLSASTMHRSPEIWGADAATFNPDRWLEGRAKFSNIAVFGKGGRDCIGRPLALAELHIGLAFLFHKYRYELQPGSDKWVSHDRFTALATEPFFVKMTPRASGEGGIIA